MLQPEEEKEGEPPVCALCVCVCLHVLCVCAFVHMCLLNVWKFHSLHRRVEQEGEETQTNSGVKVTATGGETKRKKGRERERDHRVVSSSLFSLLHPPLNLHASSCFCA